MVRGWMDTVQDFALAFSKTWVPPFLVVVVDRGVGAPRREGLHAPLACSFANHPLLPSSSASSFSTSSLVIPPFLCAIYRDRAPSNTKTFPWEGAPPPPTRTRTEACRASSSSSRRKVSLLITIAPRRETLFYNVDLFHPPSNIIYIFASPSLDFNKLKAEDCHHRANCHRLLKHSKRGSDSFFFDCFCVPPHPLPSIICLLIHKLLNQIPFPCEKGGNTEVHLRDTVIESTTSSLSFIVWCLVIACHYLTFPRKRNSSKRGKAQKGGGDRGHAPRVPPWMELLPEGAMMPWDNSPSSCPFFNMLKAEIPMEPSSIQPPTVSIPHPITQIPGHHPPLHRDPTPCCRRTIPTRR